MKLSSLANSVDFIMTSTQQNFLFVAGLLGMLWAIHLVNFMLGYRLNVLGIVPAHYLVYAVFYFQLFCTAILIISFLIPSLYLYWQT